MPRYYNGQPTAIVHNLTTRAGQVVTGAVRAATEQVPIVQNSALGQQTARAQQVLGQMQSFVRSLARPGRPPLR